MRPALPTARRQATSLSFDGVGSTGLLKSLGDDAMKRVGVVERSGRGVDKIYRGMLRFGRPEPDYRRTDAQNVVLRLATVSADEAFLKLVISEEGRRPQRSSELTHPVLTELTR